MNRHLCPPPLSASRPPLPPPPKLQRLPLPPGCLPFLRQLITEAWAEDPTARPSFPEIRRRLLEELARLDAGAGEPHPQRCYSQAESDALSAAAEGASCGPGSSSSSDGGSGGGWNQGWVMPQPQQLGDEGPGASPFAGYAARFSSSGDGSDAGG